MYPFVRLSSTIQIPTYYLVISSVVIFCLFWVARRANQRHLSHKVTLDLSLIIMISGFIGGRLLHVFYENFDYYRADFTCILFFWDGGFVFYGGALLAALISMLFLYWQASRQEEVYLDLIAPVLSLAYALGRVGCLLAGCCYGRFCDLPWAIAGRHPTQIYASLWELGVVMILLGLERMKDEHRRPHFLRASGSIFYAWMILHGTGRLLMESFRDDFRGPSLGISLSSWLSLAIMALGLYLLLRRRPTSGSTTEGRI